MVINNRKNSSIQFISCINREFLTLAGSLTMSYLPLLKTTPVLLMTSMRGRTETKRDCFSVTGYRKNSTEPTLSYNFGKFAFFKYFLTKKRIAESGRKTCNIETLNIAILVS